MKLMQPQRGRSVFDSHGDQHLWRDHSCAALSCSSFIGQFLLSGADPAREAVPPADLRGGRRALRRRRQLLATGFVLRRRSRILLRATASTTRLRRGLDGEGADRFRGADAARLQAWRSSCQRGHPRAESARHRLGGCNSPASAATPRSGFSWRRAASFHRRISSQLSVLSVPMYLLYAGLHRASPALWTRHEVGRRLQTPAAFTEL